jgi:hypothetical protein
MRAAGVQLDRATLLSPYAGCDSGEKLNRRAAALLAQDIDEAASNEPTANFVVDYLDNAQFDIWDLFALQRLSQQQESLFRSEYESALLTCAAPCPIPTAQKVLALMQTGRLSVVKGVKSIGRDESGNGVLIEHAFGTEHARYVVNATGMVDRNVNSEQQPELISNLARRGLLRPYELCGAPAPGAAVDMETFRCEGATNIYTANMFLWGPGFFVSSAIMMATIVKRLLAAAFKN